MPTHGLSPFRRFALGSIASKVLHLATCPVWTSCHLENWPAVDSLPMRLIVCALDFGPRSCAALHWASRLARDFDAKLTLAHVIRPDESTPMEPPEETLRRQRQTLHVACDTRILEGMPAPVLSALAEETDADLMVIGRTHASSPGLGANAYAIIAHAPCPVLSV
jgi:nucleotide-binding universal stress UspA family protein